MITRLLTNLENHAKQTKQKGVKKKGRLFHDMQLSAYIPNVNPIFPMKLDLLGRELRPVVRDMKSIESVSAYSFKSI